MTTRETVLQALFTLLQTISGPKVTRNDVLPEKIPPEGLPYFGTHQMPLTALSCSA